MVTKTPNHSDLQNLENRIKLEITTEQQKIRHNQNNELQKYYNMVDDLKTDSALNKQSLATMEKSINEIKEMMKELSKDIKDEIKSIKSEFVTKDELDPIKEKQKSHDEIISRVVWAIVLSFLSLIAWLVWLSKYM